MELALTPSGRITLRRTADSQGSPPASLPGAETDRQLGRLAKAFGSSQGEGLFLLATERFEGPLPPTFSYWRDFAVGYLTALCHAPDIAGLELEAIPSPTPAELATLILCVPPMQAPSVSTRRPSLAFGRTWMLGCMTRLPPTARGCRAS